jgi:hypothetical protein
VVVFLNDREKWDVLELPLSLVLVGFLEVISHQFVAGDTSGFECATFAASVYLYREVGDELKGSLCKPLMAVKGTEKDTSESQWSHTVKHTPAQLERWGVPLRITCELTIDPFIGEIKKLGKRRTNGHPQDLEKLYQLMCTQQEATEQQYRSRPTKPQHRYQSLPNRKPMAFMPCFTQHPSFSSVVQKFTARCRAREYASLVIDHSTAPAFFIVKEAQETPEAKPMRAFFTSEWQTISLCGGNRCEECGAH